ncbi:hypothetical protein BDY21DRAFT_358307 [Lineolata rhizophorae]|uniref:Secreted protein n=1 Tax=Lineolata rhizophorae TaxID=578093 RepID=A0A6A6NM21_9PEZI|nr:hypothetical protein BDY21DRAFT_358307 [Lineolata rhizophorae]
MLCRRTLCVVIIWITAGLGSAMETEARIPRLSFRGLVSSRMGDAAGGSVFWTGGAGAASPRRRDQGPGGRRGRSQGRRATCGLGSRWNFSPNNSVNFDPPCSFHWTASP